MKHTARTVYPAAYRVDPNPDPHSLLRPETRLVVHTARTQPYIFLQPSLKKSWIKKNTSIVEIDLIFDFFSCKSLNCHENIFSE